MKLQFHPQLIVFETGSIVFPKDAHAGGTWIAAHENGHAVVFLNGAFESHTSTPPYKKSRGIVLLDLINNHSPYNSFHSVNLNNIEPFTAIILDQGHLFECRWDGAVNIVKHLIRKSHIYGLLLLCTIAQYATKDKAGSKNGFQKPRGQH